MPSPTDVIDPTRARGDGQTALDNLIPLGRGEFRRSEGHCLRREQPADLVYEIYLRSGEIKNMSKETSDRTEVVGRLRSQVEELRFFVGHTEATMRRQLMSAQSSSSCHKLFKRAVA